MSNRLAESPFKMPSSFTEFLNRVQNRFRRDAARLLSRRMARFSLDVPVISFTFDDFPSSALHVAGAILRQYGIRGTYYVSLGLMEQQIPAGRAFSADDLQRLVAEGHELGCHTFAHCHAWETCPSDFEKSIVQNRRALEELMPGMVMRTLSYPISCPRPQTKRVAAKYFSCSRGGGQRHNVGQVDLDNLAAFFLEQSRDNPDAIKALIDHNIHDRGWLIFATHDVCPAPSRFGCTPAFFEDIVRFCANSGARIASIGESFNAILDPMQLNVSAGTQSHHAGIIPATML